MYETPLAAYLLLFVAIGAAFVLVHLLLGKLIRPAKPDPEKSTIYECGEPTIGSAWIQFDLRFYVIALLFVIFDVEVAFFFPWAEVFGKANDLAAVEKPQTAAEYHEYARRALALTPAHPDMTRDSSGQLVPKDAHLKFLREQVQTVTDAQLAARQFREDFDRQFGPLFDSYRRDAASLAWIAFGEIIVFFGVLLVGFAYLWKRGDLAWVRSIAAERTASAPPTPVMSEPKIEKPELVAAGSGS
jgi:NADH-quinone oxidoreductase subunit A